MIMGGVAIEELQWAHRLGLFAASILLLAVVLELVRRGRLKERYALLWLAVSLTGLVVGVFPVLILVASRALHVQYVTLLFIVSFLFLLGLVLSFSVIISRLAERNRELAQEVALLAHQVRKLEHERDE
jgi:hypothetical membrane protein